MVALGPGTPAFGDAGSVAWQPPTPAAGSVIAASAGTKLSVQLVAASLTNAVLRVKPLGKLPRGARLTATAGNPSQATLTWTPTGRQIGNHPLRFTAVDGGGVKVGMPALSLVARVAPGVVRLSGVANVSRWAFVMRKTIVRSAPRATARAKAQLSLWTPENYPNVVLALEQRIGRNGTWVKVRLPILPNNSTGWVKRGALGALRSTHDHFVVSRAATTATLYRDGTAIFKARVGVGTSFWPTPRGEFYVTEKITGFRNPAYGPIAFGTSARSPVLTDWPGGGFIGIHGTNAPSLIPGWVSHGCIRLRNGTILRLARMLKVGTPVTVH